MFYHVGRCDSIFQCQAKLVVNFSNFEWYIDLIAAGHSAASALLRTDSARHGQAEAAERSGGHMLGQVRLHHRHYHNWHHRHWPHSARTWLRRLSGRVQGHRVSALHRRGPRRRCLSSQQGSSPPLPFTAQSWYFRLWFLDVCLSTAWMTIDWLAVRDRPARVLRVAPLHTGRDGVRLELHIAMLQDQGRGARHSEKRRDSPQDRRLAHRCHRYCNNN